MAAAAEIDQNTMNLLHACRRALTTPKTGIAGHNLRTWHTWHVLTPVLPLLDPDPAPPWCEACAVLDGAPVVFACTVLDALSASHGALLHEKPGTLAEKHVVVCNTIPFSNCGNTGCKLHRTRCISNKSCTTGTRWVYYCTTYHCSLHTQRWFRSESLAMRP